jgi:hypothetical protein
MGGGGAASEGRGRRAVAWEMGRAYRGWVLRC